MNETLSAMTREDIEALVSRQAELLKHVRDVIMAFNPNHYFIEQERLLSIGQDSYWSEIMGLRRIRDSHERSISELQHEVKALKAKLVEAQKRFGPLE